MQLALLKGFQLLKVQVQYLMRCVLVFFARGLRGVFRIFPLATRPNRAFVGSKVALLQKRC
jgi:hypothetical protein